MGGGWRKGGGGGVGVHKENARQHCTRHCDSLRGDLSITEPSNGPNSVSVISTLTERSPVRCSTCVPKIPSIFSQTVFVAHFGNKQNKHKQTTTKTFKVKTKAQEKKKKKRKKKKKKEKGKKKKKKKWIKKIK